jgi:outer membrane protein OmpA-like peptidoglycan-associated protein
MSSLNASPWRVVASVGAALVLGACAGTGSSLPDRPGVYGAPAPGAAGPAATSPTTPVRPATPLPPGSTPLAAEQRFLEDWFRGTPVVIASQPPTTLQLDVPLVNSFDAGKSDIKPALNAVLERVAQSLLRHAGARITVAAPGDAGSPTLAQARAQRVRDHLGTKGIAATRVSLIESAPPGGPVQLRLSMPTVSSQPVARRTGSAGTAAAARGGGVQPISTQRTVPTWTEKKDP